MILNKKLVKLLSCIAIICCTSFSTNSWAENSATDDAKITLQVKSKLLMDKAIPSGKISVETNNGTVVLTGNLATAKQASAAIEVAESIEGVKTVDTSKLQVVGSKQPLTDGYITAKVKGIFIREKLFGDRPISASGIKVETKNGVVYLTGNADSNNQIKTAIDLVRQVEGVTGIRSDVKIK